MHLTRRGSDLLDLSSLPVTVVASLLTPTIAGRRTILLYPTRKASGQVGKIYDVEESSLS